MPPASQHGVLIQSAVTDVLGGCFTSSVALHGDPGMELHRLGFIQGRSETEHLEQHLAGLFRFLYEDI